MSENDAPLTATLTIRVRKHADGEWSAVEPNSDAEPGRGETRHEAVIAYVEQARARAREKREVVA